MSLPGGSLLNDFTPNVARPTKKTNDKALEHPFFPVILYVELLLLLLLL